VQTFTFTVVVPAAPGAQELLEALSEHMARYTGLGPEEAAEAAAALNRQVAERLGRVDGPLAITFERPHEVAPVRVEIAGPALPGDRPRPAGDRVAAGTDGRESTLTLTWSPRNSG
jgi:hypothetical protein